MSNSVDSVNTNVITRSEMDNIFNLVINYTGVASNEFQVLVNALLKKGILVNDDLRQAEMEIDQEEKTYFEVVNSCPSRMPFKIVDSLLCKNCHMECPFIKAEQDGRIRDMELFGRIAVITNLNKKYLNHIVDYLEKDKNDE
jgi:hypothetical protein